MIAAQHKDQPRPIRRERQLGDLLTVIIFECCDSCRRKGGAARHPNIAHAVEIADPGDCIAPFRRRQLCGKGIVQYLRHGKSRARPRLST